MISAVVLEVCTKWGAQVIRAGNFIPRLGWIEMQDGKLRAWKVLGRGEAGSGNF